MSQFAIDLKSLVTKTCINMTHSDSTRFQNLLLFLGIVESASLSVAFGFVCLAFPTI